MVIGGASGIGLAFVKCLLDHDFDEIFILDKDKPQILFNSKVKYVEFDLLYDMNNLDSFKDYMDIQTLIITAGFGRISEFNDLSEFEIEKLLMINTIAPIKIIKRYFDKLTSNESFNCVILSSVSAHISSPLFSVYGASKSALSSFIESTNIELIMTNTKNRILDVSPGHLNDTGFYGKTTNIETNMRLVYEIYEKMISFETLFIPEYDSIYKKVISDYRNKPVEFGIQSYDYKLERLKKINNRDPIIGYMSGTFDLFHVGHLNIIRRAKKMCDYLIIGVHEDASHKNKNTFIPFVERIEILRSILFIDQVVPSCKDDSDAYRLFNYNRLFVGSDYKNSPRFQKFEEYFKDTNVEILYFPYTEGTSSTQIRNMITDVSCPNKLKL